MSHRHGYQGRKFGRETDQRRALIKGLASQLIDHTSIRTTLPKAKEIKPYVEKLITKAKKGDLHNRRQIIAKVATVASAHKLVDEIAPKLGGRSSGYLRIVKEESRRGDNAPMARISFVDDLTEAPVAKAEVAKSSKAEVVSSKVAPKAPAKKSATSHNSQLSTKDSGSKVAKTPVKKVGKK